ncbi:acetyl-CoA acetyltransferase [Marinobacter sp. EhC06]|uniref:thiolase family protein n=1 Tax=Marinobacter TaxID=2742 RepID=UPI0007D9D92A|nr:MULTISPECIES: thiolase family protein [unclassified Marinobacter]OAN95280.1 acetyl-CoA acetyltransferase [Marinobacter sp. EhC06]OAN96005.1 acetyl-CoA acetyltransferase [Marinobacter sp. EhN04]
MRTAILSFARTPIGGLLGELSTLSATDLGAHAINAAVERAGISELNPDGVIMGCVLPAGLGQAPARQAALSAGLGIGMPATTVNKMCGSGLQAVILAHSTLLSGAADSLVCGGMESMSNAPFLLTDHRRGSKFGHGSLVDSMQRDGLEDAYTRGKSMGAFADEAAKEFGIERQEADQFACQSLARAQETAMSGILADEIAPVSVTTKAGTVEIDSDEQPRRAKLEAIPKLKPAFSEQGLVTPGNASSISDGAAAITLASEQWVRQQSGVTPAGWIVGHSVFAQEPGKFCSSPVGAIHSLLDRLQWKVSDVALFEINEAFAVVPIIAHRELGIDYEVLNVRGGACALGHPIGASGARILTTLLATLRQRGGGRGVCAICLGGGEALALAVEV